MNGKTRKLLLFILSCMFVFSCILFAGCNSGKTKVNYEKEYEWAYQREFVDEHDADMKIDGVLDENRWQNQHYLEFTEKGVTMKYTTVFTSYGLYLGATVENDYLKWNGRFNFSGFWQSTTNNSAFGFKIQGADVTEEHSFTVFNFFVDAKNAASRNQTHFEAKSTTNGNIDEGTATSMVSELFVSWDALNIEIPDNQEYPEYVRVYPAYRYVEGVKSANNKWLYPLFAEYGEARLLHRSRFNAEGYVNYDREDAVLGNAVNGICKSDGWDLTEIQNGIVSSDQYHGQAIFFKGIESDSYSYSVNVKITEESWGLNGHAGVCDMIDSELFHIFYVSGSSVLSGTRTLNFHTLNFFRDGKTSSNWHDTNEGNYTVPSGKDPFNDGVEIKVIKQKEKFFYFIYDDLVLVKEIYQIQGKTCPGLYTLSRKAVFTNYSVTDYTGRESEINALIKESAYKVFVPGNISGGLISSNSAALVLENGNVRSDLVLNVLPYSGYILTSLNLRGTVYEGVSSSLQFFADRCREGVLVIPKEDIIDDVVVTADFTYITRCGISASDIVAVKGNVQKRNGTKASNTAVYIYNEYATLCYSTTTTSDGNYSFLLPKDGTVLNGHTVDGNYTLVINGYNYGYGFIEKIIDIPDTHSGDIINNFILDTLEVVSSGNDLFVSENGHQRIESLGTVVSDGNAHYKTSEKITEIPLRDYQEGNTDVYASFGMTIAVPTQNIAGIRIQDEDGNYITVRITNGRWTLYKQNGAAEFKGFNFTEKGVAADGTYNLKIDVQERRVIAFYVDGVLFNAQFIDLLGSATNLGLSDFATKLEIYLIWTDDDTQFDLSMISTEQKNSRLTVIGDGITVTVDGEQKYSGDTVDFRKEITINYTNAFNKITEVYVNGQLIGTLGVGESLSKSYVVGREPDTVIKFVTIDTVITYDGDLWVAREDGTAIESGTEVDYDDLVKITVINNDKYKISSLYVNGKNSGQIVVNGEQTFEFRVTGSMYFNVVETDFPAIFKADASGDTAMVSEHLIGVDGDGNLVGPNVNKYASTGKIALYKDTVYTATLKLNNSYGFGTVFDVGGNWLRIQARPWVKDAGGVGDFRNGYITITNSNVNSGNAMAYKLATYPDDDEVTIKVIFNSEEEKIYLIINGENFTDKVFVPYSGKEKLFVRFNHLAELDTQTPGYYKSWSILSFAEDYSEPDDKIYTNSKDLTGTTVSDGKAQYTMSEKIAEISLHEYQAGNTDVYASFENSITVPTENIAGIRIQDEDGNYITVRIVNDRWTLYKKNGTVEFKGFNFTDKSVAADGTYNLKIDVQERRVLAFYVDGVLFNAQFMDSLGNASTNLGLDSSTTKLSIYLIWTDDDTVFGLYPNE